MPLYLFFMVVFFNIKGTNNPPVNTKSPTVSEIFQKFNDNNINKDPIEITYVIDGCDYLMIYKISLTKQGKDYSLKLSVPPKSQDVFHNFKELMKKVRYYKTFTISYQKFKKLESALEPKLNIRSTTGNFWTIKYGDDFLDLSDRSAGNEFTDFIHRLR